MTSGKLNITKPLPKSFEGILDYLGGFGKFQVFVLVVLACLDFPSAFLGLLPMFSGAKPKFWTCGNEKLQTGSDVCKCNGTLSAPNPYTSIVGEWSLVCGNSWIVDSITSVQMCGSLFASLFLSQVADWYGRRIAMNGIGIIFAFGALLSTLAPNVYLFALGRFFVGAGSGGSQGLSTVYIIEFMPPIWRPLPTSVRPYGEGIMLLGVLAYIFRPWRTLAWVTTSSILVIVCILPFVPESPRWLMQNHQISEAHRVLGRIAKMNNRPALEESLIREISEKEMGSTNSNGQQTAKGTYWSIFKDKALRRRALCLIVLWISWGTVGFGLAFNIKNVPGNPYLNVVYLGLAESLGYPTSLLILNRLGRRVSAILTMTLGAMILSALAALCLTINIEDYSGLVLSMYILAKYSMAIARCALRCLAAESFPTPVRSMGTGICGISVAIGGMICPQFVYLGSSNPTIPLFAFAAISIVGSLFAILMPETEGKPLEDTIVKRLSRRISQIFLNSSIRTSKEDVGPNV